MSWLGSTLALYQKAFRQAAVLALRNWPVLGTMFVYATVMGATLTVAGALGILGGILLSLVWAACVGSFLYLVEMMIRTGRVSLADFRRSMGAYLWDVVGVTFILWVVFALVTPFLLAFPQGPAIILGLNLVVFVLFNAVPELIYLGHCSSLELLSESYAFISENWVEWFPANIAASALLWVVSVVPLAGVAALAQAAVGALLLYFVMVMRGLLFLELHGSSRRGRAFRYRMGG